MKQLRVSVLVLTLAMAALTTSCSWLGLKRAKAKTPPAPQPTTTQTERQAPTEAAPPKSEQVALPAPPQIPASTAPAQPPPYAPAPYPPRPAPPKRQRREPAAEAAATPATPTDAAPAAPVPQLEQILTPEQQAAYNEEIDRNIGRAQKTITSLNGKSLSAEQKLNLDRIRAFIQQAADARKTDLFRAKNLAERASVLADDLFRTVQ